MSCWHCGSILVSSSRGGRFKPIYSNDKYSLNLLNSVKTVKTLRENSIDPKYVRHRVISLTTSENNVIHVEYLYPQDAFEPWQKFTLPSISKERYMPSIIIEAKRKLWMKVSMISNVTKSSGNMCLFPPFICFNSEHYFNAMNKFHLCEDGMSSVCRLP